MVIIFRTTADAEVETGEHAERGVGPAREAGGGERRYRSPGPAVRAHGSDRVGGAHQGSALCRTRHRVGAGERTAPRASQQRPAPHDQHGS